MLVYDDAATMTAAINDDWYDAYYRFKRSKASVF